MPNFDGKGPRGNRTAGKSLGKCKRAEMTTEDQPRSIGGRGKCGTGLGKGQGRGRGCAQGQGNRNGQCCATQ